MADDDIPLVSGWRLRVLTWVARFMGCNRIYQGDTLIWERDADKEKRTDG